MRTMWEALKICIPITLMTFAIFVRDEMVVTPGWMQIFATILVTIGTVGISFAMFGRFTANRAANILFRNLVALVSLIILLHPDNAVALAAAAVVFPVVVVGVFRHHRLGADPAAIAAAATAELGHRRDGGEAAVMTEARREV